VEPPAVEEFGCRKFGNDTVGNAGNQTSRPRRVLKFAFSQATPARKVIKSMDADVLI
jgi:hypothetical protein